MADIELSAAALADLEDIYEYGAASFGIESADLYSRGFGAVFDRLRRYPRSGVTRPELGEGVRSMLYRQHRMYYIIRDAGVLVLRVIHGARDVQDLDFL
jgi:toxin ParE1/3/4